MLVFRKFVIAEKFMDMRDGDYQDFFIKFFCLTVLKILVGQHFRVSLISGIEKFYAEEGYVMIFRRTFVSQYRKILQGNPSVLCFGKVSGSKILWIRREGVLRFAVENFLSHSVETIFRGTILCWFSENL